MAGVWTAVQRRAGGRAHLDARQGLGARTGGADRGVLNLSCDGHFRMLVGRAKVASPDPLGHWVRPRLRGLPPAAVRDRGHQGV